MKKINVLFTLYSLLAVIVIIERLFPATRLLLPPYNFIRLHEINQTVLFLTFTVVLSFVMLQEITDNFQSLRKKGSAWWAVIFVAGTYLYGAGEGWHEVASFTFNTYCNTNHIVGLLCGGLFMNDYYAGNIIFFVGGVMMNTALLVLAAQNPTKPFGKKDMTILLLNSVVYASTWFAYAAFDRVLVGLFFSSVLLLLSAGFFIARRKKLRAYPFISYSFVAYFLATVATLIVKFH